MKLKHRDITCPMYNTCSSLGYISENCSIQCYRETTQQEKKDNLLELYRKWFLSKTTKEQDEITNQIVYLEKEMI